MARREEAYEEDSLRPAEKRRRRRQKARRRMLVRLIAVVLIVTVVAVAWTYWDTLAPDKLLDKFNDSFGAGAGSYPVDIAGTNARRLAQCGNYTTLLSDTHLTFYDSDGGEVKRYTVPSSNALLRQAGRYILLAEQGGRRVQLLTRSSLIAEITTEHDILSASVNAKGQMAVLTEGPQGYAVEVTVYNRQGRAVYARSRNQVSTEVTLSEDGKQVVLLSVAAEDGDLNTTISVFAVNSAAQEAVCSYVTDDVLLYRVEYLTDQWLVSVGEDGVVFLDTSDGLATVYTLGDRRLLGYAVADTTLALVTREYGDTGNGQVQIINKKGEPLSTTDFTGDFRHLTATDGRYLLLTDSAVTEITRSGAGRTATSSPDGQQAVLAGGKVVVLGVNMLQSYTWE